MTKFILTEEGLGVTFHTTLHKMYEGELNGSNMAFKNDQGNIQSLSWSSAYLIIPEDGFVGMVANVAHELIGISDADYEKCKPMVFHRGAGQRGTVYFKDAMGDIRHPNPEYVAIIADPYNVAPRQVKPHYDYASLGDSGVFHDGQLVTLTPKGMDYLDNYDAFEEDTPYILQHDGSKVSPWYIRSPRVGNHIFLTPEACCIPCSPSGIPLTQPAPVNVGVPTPIKVETKPIPAIVPDVLTEETNGRIKKQKAVAAEILEKASIMDGWAFIAGGAPRNWELNRVAKDIDIFVRLPKKASEERCMRSLELLGVTDLFNMATQNPDGSFKKRQEIKDARKHNTSSNIVYVFEGKYMGEVVQFIFRENDSLDPATYIRRYFDTSINMLFILVDYDCNMVTSYLDVYKTTMKTGIIFVEENRSSYASDHLERIASYFPDQPLVLMEHRHLLAKEPDKAWEYHRDWEDFNTDDDEF